MSTAPRSASARRDWGDDDSESPILHVDMDSFFASVEIALDPSLAGRPLIVGGVGLRGVVTSTTYDVRACGVKAGMPIGRARALAPQAVVLPGRRDAYREFSSRVMAIMAQVTPVFEVVSIDEAYLDVSGCRKRLGRPTKIAEQIREQIREQEGLPASVGIANSKTVAKIASSHAKPDGVLLVPAASTVRFLHLLPIGALPGIGKRTGEVLERLGIETVGELAHTPEPELTRAVGEAHSRRLLAVSWGKDERAVGGESPEKSISTEETFSHNLSDRGELEAFLLEAAHSCAVRLRDKGMVARTVQIKLRDGDFRTITRSFTLIVPTDLGREIGKVAVVMVRREKMPRTGIRLAGVGVQGLTRREDGVQTSFDEDGRPLAAERAMDAVNRRFGRASLGPATFLDGVEQNRRISSDVPKMGAIGRMESGGGACGSV